MNVFSDKPKGRSFMFKTVATIIFSIIIGWGVDLLNVTYEVKMNYGVLVSGVLFLFLYMLASSFYSKSIYKVTLTESFDRFFFPVKPYQLAILTNLPLIVAFMAYNSNYIESFVFITLSVAVGDIYYFNNHVNKKGKN
ncbi:hypothetical protein [Shewanella colwelliana]|nr:hypothetical protein [Shewanella colwelliana]